jgi:transcription termination factor Rho
MSHNTPFFHGNPIPPNKLIGRNNELYTIAGRISTGQSTAITGSPRSGKTSILQYLEKETKLYDNEKPEKQTELYDEDIKEKLIFSYLDAYTWGTESYHLSVSLIEYNE